MAFGVNRSELNAWKSKVMNGEIAFLTHYWLDDRFPNCHTVTKVGCNNLDKLIKWGEQYKLQSHWIHDHEKFPHFDLFGDKQIEILLNEQMSDHIRRFKLIKGV